MVFQSYEKDGDGVDLSAKKMKPVLGRHFEQVYLIQALRVAR